MTWQFYFLQHYNASTKSFATVLKIQGSTASAHGYPVMLRQCLENVLHNSEAFVRKISTLLYFLGMVAH